MMFTVRFWRDAAERALKTGAQAALLAAGAERLNVFDADLAGVAGFGIGGVLLSLLTSLGSDVLPFGTKGTASLAKLDQ